MQRPHHKSSQMADISIVTGDHNDRRTQHSINKCAGEVTRRKDRHVANNGCGPVVVPPPPPPPAPHNNRARVPDSKAGQQSSINNGDAANEKPGEKSARDGVSRSEPKRPLVAQPSKAAAEQHETYLESPLRSNGVSYYVPDHDKPSRRTTDTSPKAPSCSTSAPLQCPPKPTSPKINAIVLDPSRMLPSVRRDPHTYHWASAQGESQSQTAGKAIPESPDRANEMAMQNDLQKKRPDWRRERTEIWNVETLVIPAYVLLSITSHSSLTSCRVTLAASLALSVAYWVACN
jgi:hypothetical protein